MPWPLSTPLGDLIVAGLTACKADAWILGPSLGLRDQAPISHPPPGSQNPQQLAQVAVPSPSSHRARSNLTAQGPLPSRSSP
jgi:hypothetical protein